MNPESHKSSCNLIFFFLNKNNLSVIMKHLVLFLVLKTIDLYEEVTQSLTYDLSVVDDVRAGLV